MTVRKIRAGRVTTVTMDQFVGDVGTLFYNENTGEMRVSNGVDPGGNIVSYVLPIASNVVLGGIKLGTGFAIDANGVASVIGGGGIGSIGATGATGATGIQGNVGPAGASSNIAVYDEGNLVVANIGSINFVGAIVTANASDSNVTVTLSGNVSSGAASDRLTSGNAEVILNTAGPEPYVLFPAASTGGQLQISEAEISSISGNLALTSAQDAFVISNGDGSVPGGSKLWKFNRTGNLTLPQTDMDVSSAPVSWPGIIFSDGTFQNTAYTGGGGGGSDYSDANVQALLASNVSVVRSTGNIILATPGGGATTTIVTHEGGMPGPGGFGVNTITGSASNSPGFALIQPGWTVTGNNLVGTTTVTSKTIDGFGIYTITTDTVVVDPFWYQDVFTFTSNTTSYRNLVVDSGNIVVDYGQIQFVANSSGDGYGLSTIRLVPYTAGYDSAYIIIDPTYPNHIHIRAGGEQDNSPASLFLGGENSHFRVDAGVDPDVFIRSNNNDWTFDTGGNLTISKTTPHGGINRGIVWDWGLGQAALGLGAGEGSNSYIRQTENGLEIHPNEPGGMGDGDLRIRTGNISPSGTSYDWIFNGTGNLTLPQTNMNASPAPISLPGITFTDGTFQATAYTGAAATVDILNTNNLSNTFYPTFVEFRTTGQYVRADVDFTYRSDSNTLTVPKIAGMLEGNVNHAGGYINFTGSPSPVSTGIAFADGTSQTTAWTRSAAAVQSTPPASPVTGQLYYDTDDSRTYIYTGSAWIDANPAGSGGSAALDEAFGNLTAATGVVTHDCTTNRLFYHTSMSANFTANFINLNLSAGRSTSISLVLVQGGTARMVTAVQIGGVAQTITWQGSASAPAGNANRTDAVTFSILNVGGTYTVLGMMTSFGGV